MFLAPSRLARVCLVVATLGAPLAACGGKPDDAATAAAERNAPATPTPASAAPAPSERAKLPEATGVALTLTRNGTEKALTLSREMVAARPAGSPMAAFSCLAVTGMVTITDFSIGDDPARKGELFSVSVTRTNIESPTAGKVSDARFTYREAGEAPLSGVGTMVWDEGLQSGSATGKGDNGDTLAVTWKCLTAE